MTVLNNEQKRIISDSQGVKLVISGPGTGKTTTVTHFLANILARKKAKPEQVLAVTFTVKAAREMEERVRELTGQNPDVFTIHSFARRVVSSYPPPGYTSDFLIIDDKQQWRLLRQLIKRQSLDIHPQAAKEILGLARNTRDELLLEKHKLSPLYKSYMQALKQNNAMDFDALLTWSVWVLNNNSAAWKDYSTKYRYLLVDEFQDTSRLQYALLLPLARATGNLLCVGDYDQSIYGFRGADVSLILNLEKDFPNLSTHYLKQNYRSTKAIVQAANALIAKNQKRRPKPHLTDRPQGDAVIRRSFADQHREMEFVASTITKCKNMGAAWSDFAVLYRMHTLGILLTQVLTEKQIPYRVVGDTDYFDLPEIKNILCFFRLKEKPDNPEAAGDALSVLSNLEHSSPRRKLALIMELLAPMQDLVEIYRAILKQTGMMQQLQRNTSQRGIKAVENVEELETVLNEFSGKGIESFLQFTRQARSAQDQDAVNLLTIHAAKGLEYDTVFVVGVDDEMLPHSQNKKPDEIEEERRLFYVAITRAKNQLYLTYPRKRRVKERQLKLRPSRFLAEALDSQQKTQVQPASLPSFIKKTSDYRAEAEASRKENPQGPWLDSSGNRWGICKHCSQFTRDWWSLDGETNVCQCNDCRYK